MDDVEATTNWEVERDNPAEGVAPDSNKRKIPAAPSDGTTQQSQPSKKAKKNTGGFFKRKRKKFARKPKGGHKKRTSYDSAEARQQLDLDPTAPQQQIISAINDTLPQPPSKPVQSPKSKYKRKSGRLETKVDSLQIKVGKVENKNKILQNSVLELSNQLKTEKKKSHLVIQEANNQTALVLEENLELVEETNQKKKVLEEQILKEHGRYTEELQKTRANNSRAKAKAQEKHKKNLEKLEKTWYEEVKKGRTKFNKAKVCCPLYPGFYVCNRFALYHLIHPSLFFNFRRE